MASELNAQPPKNESRPVIYKRILNNAEIHIANTFAHTLNRTNGAPPSICLAFVVCTIAEKNICAHAPHAYTQYCETEQCEMVVCGDVRAYGICERACDVYVCSRRWRVVLG